MKFIGNLAPSTEAEVKLMGSGEWKTFRPPRQSRQLRVPQGVGRRAEAERQQERRQCELELRHRGLLPGLFPLKRLGPAWAFVL